MSSAKAIIHNILSPATAANLLMHVVLLSSFIAVLFFGYGSKIEENVVKKQTVAIVDSLTEDIKNIVPPDQLQKLKPYLDQYLTVPDMTTADQEAAQKNKQLMDNAIKTLGIVAAICIGVIILLWVFGKYYKSGKYYWSPLKLLKDNVISLAFVAITEVAFLTFVAQNFKSADPSAVKLQIIQTLQKFGQS